MNDLDERRERETRAPQHKKTLFYTQSSDNDQTVTATVSHSAAGAWQDDLPAASVTSSVGHTADTGTPSDLEGTAKRNTSSRYCENLLDNSLYTCSTRIQTPR